MCNCPVESVRSPPRSLHCIFGIPFQEPGGLPRNLRDPDDPHFLRIQMTAATDTSRISVACHRAIQQYRQFLPMVTVM
jgi:hypothetical protein